MILALFSSRPNKTASIARSRLATAIERDRKDTQLSDSNALVPIVIKAIAYDCLPIARKLLKASAPSITLLYNPSTHLATIKINAPSTVH